ncbi:MAG: polyprenol monophosphomannose synthase, partial [Flavobacteriaceae bacterium]
DGTAQAVQQLQATYSDRLFLEQRPKKEGLGPAYLHGFCWALPQDFEYLIQMDADFSHDPEDLTLFVASLEKGSDVVVGSRYSDGVTVVNWPLSRILLSYFASQFVQLMTRMPIKDPTAGYVGYRKAVLESLDLGAIRYVGYAYQIEMKYKAWKKGFKLTEIPIVFKNRVKGHSKMSGQIIWEAFFGVLFLPLQNLFRKK